jgi:hydroxymethylpyrimidine/phosphomethylpyrimidine kinase
MAITSGSFPAAAMKTCAGCNNTPAFRNDFCRRRPLCMNSLPKLPVALTIAGSDSGGGAGIQADLKTFAALGVHGTSAIACLTAQNPRRVLGVEPCSPKLLRQQIEAVFEELPPAAVKTGMLFSADNIRIVAGFFAKAASPNPLVVDPVMISTSGAKLLQPAAIKIMMEKLLPLARLVTPNLDEAQILTGRKLTAIEDLREAARKIHARFGCAALVKGGHLKNSREAIDIFFDGQTELLLSAPFVKGVSTHGTGCTYSAAICAALALGHDLPHAVEIGKNFITAAIVNSYRIGKHFALGQLAVNIKSSAGTVAKWQAPSSHAHTGCSCCS